MSTSSGPELGTVELFRRRTFHHSVTWLRRETWKGEQTEAWSGHEGICHEDRASDHSSNTFHLCSVASGGKIVRLLGMGGNQSVPKITPRDRAILEYAFIGSCWFCLC